MRESYYVFEIEFPSRPFSSSSTPLISPQMSQNCVLVAFFYGKLVRILPSDMFQSYSQIVTYYQTMGCYTITMQNPKNVLVYKLHPAQCTPKR